jgi:pyruvate formate lyase activating enzyme
MVIGGFAPLTLLDYPGKVAATVFTVGCNFRCPFCHNPELVLAQSGLEKEKVKEKEFFDFLKKRQKKLDGVCITGGEPTLQKDLVEFISKIKALGFLVKLDTNGTRPDVLKRLLDQKLLDFVAMDIKTSIEKYPQACGVKVDPGRIQLSTELIRNNQRIDYEFRTTVAGGIHTEDDLRDIGRWLRGAKRYVLQCYEDQGKILDENRREEMKKKPIDLIWARDFLQEKYFEEVIVR